MDQQLVDDINAFCTAFLGYDPNMGGSWGNSGDMIEQMLMAAAEEAFHRDQILAGAVRAHVEQVFLRSGMKPERADREAERAYDIFHGVQAFLGSPSRTDYLEHARKRPLHRACDPSTDKRFSKPPRKLTYKNSPDFQAWVCATDAEVMESGLDRNTPNAGCAWLHRLDGPAMAIGHAEFGDEEWWIQHGRIHREGAPARTWTGPDGTRYLEHWYTNGVHDPSKDVDRRNELEKLRRPTP